MKGMWLYFTYDGWPGPDRHLKQAPKNFQYKHVLAENIRQNC